MREGVVTSVMVPIFLVAFCIRMPMVAVTEITRNHPLAVASTLLALLWLK